MEWIIAGGIMIVVVTIAGVIVGTSSKRREG